MFTTKLYMLKNILKKKKPYKLVGRGKQFIYSPSYEYRKNKALNVDLRCN